MRVVDRMVAMSREPAGTRGLLELGEDVTLDQRAYELRRGGRTVRLERIPMELLLFLVEERGRLITREQIVERIWGKGVSLDADNSINGAVRKIRHALRDDPERPRLIQTITGKGYRFIAPVFEIPDEPRAAPAIAGHLRLHLAPSARRSPSLNLRRRSRLLGRHPSSRGGGRS